MYSKDSGQDQHPQSWLAWISIAQVYLFVKIANKSNRWFWAIASPFALMAAVLLLYIVSRSVPGVGIILAGLYLIGLIGSVVGAVIVIIVWKEILEKLGKAGWLTGLLLIPFIDLIFLGYLAFGPSSPVIPIPQPPAH